MHKLLIANRGEIAVRILRACRELGIAPIAVFSEADAAAMHVRLADAAVSLGPSPAADSYLRIDKIVDAAHRSGADAVHPGYGFLSENAEFAEAVQAAGLIWVGPPPSAMRAMGDKMRARSLMQAANVPIVPGYHEAPGGDFAKAAESIGYPVLVKAAAGGGGRGMRIVRQAADLKEAIDSARAEAHSAFGDATVFLEKYVENSRHIEFQVFGDAHGHVVHLFERECSVQRRHQKILEETPSPLLEQHPALRAAMGNAAVAAAAAVGYQNAGTIEFIVDPASLAFYFLEMNTRLQVEHPITELTTGLDLVKLQLRVAAGLPLPFTQEQVVRRGHALECRLYAEDPAQGYLPSIGKILLAVEARGPGVRVDGGYESGDAVSQYYDALLAKVIVIGSDRAECVRRMDAALAQTVVLGVATNVPFLRAILAHSIFQAGVATTEFASQYMDSWQPDGDAPPDEVFIAAAIADAIGAAAETGRASALSEDEPIDRYDPWRKADGFRLGGH